MLYALAVNEFSSPRLTPWAFAFLESKKCILNVGWTDFQRHL